MGVKGDAEDFGGVSCVDVGVVDGDVGLVFVFMSVRSEENSGRFVGVEVEVVVGGPGVYVVKGRLDEERGGVGDGV